MPVNQMMQGSLYELDSNQISKIIYQERRRLDIIRFKRLLKRRQEEKTKELENLQDQLKNATGIDDDVNNTNNDNDYFMTQVEQEEVISEKQSSEHPSMEVNEEPEEQLEEEIKRQSNVPPKPNFFKNSKPAFFHQKSTSESRPGSAMNSALIQKSYAKNKLGPNPLLKIDSRWNCVPKHGEPLDDKEHFKRVYTFDGAMKGRRRPFVPTMKPKRHPQLEKIEAYFKDCNPEYIPRSPLMKIPTIFEIEREMENRVGNVIGNNNVIGNGNNTGSDVNLEVDNNVNQNTGFKYTYPGGTSNYSDYNSQNIVSNGRLASMKGMVSVEDAESGNVYQH